MNRAALRYMYGVAATFWCVLAVLVAREAGALVTMWAVWLPLLGLAMTAEAFEVGTSSETAGGVMSFSAAAHIAAVILLGPVLAALVAAAAVVLVDGVRAQRPVVVAVNSAMFGWASLAAGAVYLVAGGHTGRVSSAWGAALVAVVVARYAVNALVYAIGESLATGAQTLIVAREKLLDGASAGLGEGSLGVLLAAGWSAGRWITLPFLLPLFAALYSSKSNLERLRQETAAALNAFARVIDERDPNTARHTERVAGYVQRFVEAIGLPSREADRLVQAAHYHDLGKIAIDEATLSKSGRLTDAELRAIRRHPRLSAKLLQPYGFASEIARYVELHHERYDGRGYYGVAAAETAIEAHVLIVADSFDAMTSARAYRLALSTEEAAQELLQKAGTQFHPLVARAFVAVIEGRDVREALSADELRELLGAFERIAALPRPHLTVVREARIGFVCLVGSSMIGVAVLQSAAARIVTLAIAAAVGVVLGFMTVRERQRMMSALRRAERGDPLETSLAAVGVSAESRWLVWDPARDLYASDGSVADEVAVRAGRVATAEPIRLTDGRYAVYVDREPDARVAVLLRQKPSEFELSLIRRTARLARPSAEVRRLRSAPAAAPAHASVVIVVRLDAFERIRRAAGQLTATRCVRDARLAVQSLLRASDAVELHGDDQLVIRLGDASEADAEPICSRVAEVLGRVAVPQRVDPIAASFSVERAARRPAVSE
jgi:GGDEF domain-containing protein